MENPSPEESIPVAKKPRRQEELPIDLVSLILLSLSVKTLGKFRCVCKSWRSLISSPQFQQDHYNRRSNESPILLLALKIFSEVGINTIFRMYNTMIAAPLDKLNMVGINTIFHMNNTMKAAPLDEFTIDMSLLMIHFLDTPIQSCRGLLCLVSNNHIFLCNPSTHEVMPLPLPHTERSYQCIGFGYVASTEDFKVVRFLPGLVLDPTKVTHCQVFTMRTRQWRQAKSPPPFSVGTGGAPFVHGALHLLPPYLYRTESYNNNIFAFDVETEEYRAIRLPEYYYSLDRKYSFNFLTKLGSSLCLTFDFTTRLELWLLADYANVEWMRLCTIQTSNLIDYSIRYNIRSNPIAVLSDARILINVEGQNWTNELLCYDPQGRVATEKWGEGLAAYYVESFFSLGTR